MSWEPNRLEEKRLEKLERLREAGIDPYPLRSGRTHTVGEAVDLFAKLEAATPAGEAIPQETVTVTGRLVSFRDMGKSVFGHIEDGTGRIQLFARREEVGEESHLQLRKLTDLGDFVEATGYLVRTRTGEISVRASSWRMLTKSLSPLPVIKEEKDENGNTVRYGGFSDVEERYRQRYADLAVNPEVRETFRIRARMISALRRYMDDHEFLEVETPVLQPIYGGAAARPFTTYHNQLKQELYLRISFELYLKRLLVGGFERVYEIGRDFRNEGVSYKHNPEFTQLEFYAAYWDYNDVMSFVEGMVKYAAQEVLGTTMVHYRGNAIDLGQKWHRSTLRDAIEEFAGIDYVQYPDADSLRAAIRARGGQAPADATWGRLVDNLMGDYVEPHLIQPTFLTQYPRDISPFAKKLPEDATHVERFELFLGGMEMGNAFTELNDPLDQAERFAEAAQMYAAEDDEHAPVDEDYLRAMRYGMPPNGGFGMGVDRLAILFANQPNIREVLLYPHLRDRNTA